MNQLQKFSQLTTIVADTADLSSIKNYHPQDATTNPSLILKNAAAIDLAFAIPEAGRSLIKSLDVIEEDILYIEAATEMGVKILEIIPGRISTEVPSRYSFDTDRTVALARHIIARYRDRGISSERVLIKIASTWEGIQAAKTLEKEGVRCNMTLLFSLSQAIACAEAGVTLISPFVGRVYDWYKKRDGLRDNDPGVDLVTEIYHYYKKFGYPVEIMGASFRTLEQVLALAGCDLLTISPSLLGELEKYPGEITPRLNPDASNSSPLTKRSVDEKTFRWEICQDAMAVEKLAEGIRIFHQDFVKLNQLLIKK